MVDVATRDAVNPVKTLADAVGAAAVSSFVIPTLEMPSKMVIGYHMLGLGDITLPALLGVLALRFDLKKFGRSRLYFLTFVVSYCFGLMFASAAVLIFMVAQPALLYIVPCCLAPMLTFAWLRGELNDLWHGNVLPKVESFKT